MPGGYDGRIGANKVVPQLARLCGGAMQILKGGMKQPQAGRNVLL